LVKEPNKKIAKSLLFLHIHPVEMKKEILWKQGDFLGNKDTPAFKKAVWTLREPQ